MFTNFASNILVLIQSQDSELTSSVDISMCIYRKTPLWILVYSVWLEIIRLIRHETIDNYVIN